MRTRLGCLSHKSDSCSDFTAILPDKPNRALKWVVWLSCIPGYPQGWVSMGPFSSVSCWPDKAQDDTCRSFGSSFPTPACEWQEGIAWWHQVGTLIFLRNSMAISAWSCGWGSIFLYSICSSIWALSLEINIQSYSKTMLRFILSGFSTYSVLTLYSMMSQMSPYFNLTHLWKGHCCLHLKRWRIWGNSKSWPSFVFKTSAVPLPYHLDILKSQSYIPL